MRRLTFATEVIIRVLKHNIPTKYFNLEFNFDLFPLKKLLSDPMLLFCDEPTSGLGKCVAISISFIKAIKCFFFYLFFKPKKTPQWLSLL